MTLDDDDFTLLGLEPRFAIDRESLDRRWRALQAEVHPDRFVGEGGSAQRVAAQWAMRVNQAHQRLKDPLRRAAYLCELRGAPVDAERNTAMPADFLTQQMSWREALEDAGDTAALERIDAEVRAHEERLLDELRATLDERDRPAEAAQQVRALMFVARFRDDVRRRVEALDV